MFSKTNYLLKQLQCFWISAHMYSTYSFMLHPDSQQQRHCSPRELSAQRDTEEVSAGRDSNSTDIQASPGMLSLARLRKASFSEYTRQMFWTGEVEETTTSSYRELDTAESHADFQLLRWENVTLSCGLRPKMRLLGICLVAREGGGEGIVHSADRAKHGHD